MKRPILKKNAKPLTKPLKTIEDLAINKRLDSLKSRSTSKNANYKRRDKELDLKIKELNKTANIGEQYFFNGKKIVKFNYNHMALTNITKLLPPKDKKILRGISAEISLRISKQIIKNNVVFLNNKGQVENMTPAYLLSLPLDKLKTLVTDYEYKKLFSIIKRVPEKNLNYIVRNYSEVVKISEKNNFILAANILLKATIADAKGFLKKDTIKKEKLKLSPMVNAEKKVIRKQPLSLEENIYSNFPLYYKYFSKNPAFNARETYEKYNTKYFKLMESLLKTFQKDFPGKKLPISSQGVFQRFVTERLNGVKGARRPSMRYNRYYSDLKKLIEK